MDIYAQLAEKIIKSQENIIGPVAVEQAKAVEGLNIDWAKHSISITGNESHVIDLLVEQYKKLFGQISVEVCKEAAGRLAQELSPDQIPASLR